MAILGLGVSILDVTNPPGLRPTCEGRLDSDNPAIVELGESPMAGRQASAAMLMQIPDAIRSDADGPQQEAMRLFAEHGTGLYRFCVFTLRHHQDAEDV